MRSCNIIYSSFPPGSLANPPQSPLCYSGAFSPSAPCSSASQGRGAWVHIAAVILLECGEGRGHGVCPSRRKEKLSPLGPAGVLSHPRRLFIEAAPQPTRDSGAALPWRQRRLLFSALTGDLDGPGPSGVLPGLPFVPGLRCRCAALSAPPAVSMSSSNDRCAGCDLRVISSLWPGRAFMLGSETASICVAV